MAITANITVANQGFSLTGAYLKIPGVKVRKLGDGSFRLIYDVSIFTNQSARNTAGSDGRQPEPSVRVKGMDHFSATYDPASNSNPWAQAYANLKTKTSLLASISDA
jgi:hypothetical protein